MSAVISSSARRFLQKELGRRWVLLLWLAVIAARMAIAVAQRVF